MQKLTDFIAGPTVADHGHDKAGAGGGQVVVMNDGRAAIQLSRFQVNVMRNPYSVFL